MIGPVVRRQAPTVVHEVEVTGPLERTQRRSTAVVLDDIEEVHTRDNRLMRATDHTEVVVSGCGDQPRHRSAMAGIRVDGVGRITLELPVLRVIVQIRVGGLDTIVVDGHLDASA